jgi:membrane protein DedA with SNARE-associated domain
MLHWLHSLLPHIPHYGYVLVFIVAFLNNLGFPLPGETILLGAGFVLWKTGDPLWQPVVAGTAACFLGGIGAFWLGRRLGRGSLEKIRWLHLTPERMKWPEQFFNRHGAKTVFIARFIFFISARRGQSAGRHVENALAHFFVLQCHGIGGLFHHLHLDRLLFREEVETTRSLAGSHGALPDSRGAGHYGSRRDFQTFRIRILGTPFPQKPSAKIMDAIGGKCDASAG